MEYDIGVDLKVTPNAISAEAVKLAATMEPSNLPGRSAGARTQVLSTDQTSAEGSGSIHVGRQVAPAPAATTASRSAASGGATARRADILAPVALRRPQIGGEALMVGGPEAARGLPKVPPKPVERIPAIDFLAWLR